MHDVVALVPYTIFSLFHALTFSRTSLLPQILPPGPPPTAGGTPQPHPFAKKLQIWVKSERPGQPMFLKLLMVHR